MIKVGTGDWGSWEGNSNLQFSFQGIVKDSPLVSAEEEEGEKDGGKTQEIAHPPQVLGPDVWDSLITYKLELPCLTDCLIDTVFFAPHLLL